MPKKHQGSYPIKAVGTTGMVADLVRNVGGEHVEVHQLLGADIDPHVYKPTDKDTSRLAGADIIFYSGLHLEGKMSEMFERMASKNACIGVADLLDRKLLAKDEENAWDPHIWFDVALWSKAAGVVGEALALYDPANATTYKANLARYQKELDDLHGFVERRIAEIPEKHRVLITSHDAFRYFGRAYKIEVHGIQGISTDVEASVADITRLVNFIVERKVRAVFVETSVNPRNMDALIEGCAKKGHQVARGGTLFSDAMGEEGTPEGTYAGMIRHNVNTVVTALK
ncbi:MAG: zinc ABC transporter substrate-binding protein [Gemmataceae bacterium]|nr:zinc ABC transporter substrate-binding protein [Gemmataceae bacterium]